MKKHRVITMLGGIAVVLSFLLLNVGILRCESRPGAPGNLPPQAKSDSPAFGKTGDQSWLEEREEKSERFKELEWLIKQKLLKQYEKMEIKEDLDD